MFVKQRDDGFLASLPCQNQSVSFFAKVFSRGCCQFQARPRFVLSIILISTNCFQSLLLLSPCVLNLMQLIQQYLDTLNYSRAFDTTISQFFPLFPHIFQGFPPLHEKKKFLKNKPSLLATLSRQITIESVSEPQPFIRRGKKCNFQILHHKQSIKKQVIGNNINLKMQQYLDQFLRPVRIPNSGYDFGPLFMNRKTTKKEYKISGVPFSVYLHNSSSPTILYIHTYNSNRTEVRTILNHALKKGFNVVSVEVQRVGFTEEKEPKVDPKGIITFGYFEYEQIRVVMEWIKAKINCEVIIWGRSMGAVCAVRYQHRYGDACQLVLDSPFHNLRDLFTLKLTELTFLPAFFAKAALVFTKSTISNKLNFDIDNFTLDQEMDFPTPTTFLFNREDAISNTSCELLYAKCKGKKQIFYLECPHEGERESKTLEKVLQQLTKKHHDNPMVKKKEINSSRLERMRNRPALYQSTVFEEEEKIPEKNERSATTRSLLQSSCLF